MRIKIHEILKTIESGQSQDVQADRNTIDQLEQESNASIPINDWNNDIVRLQNLAGLSDAFRETFKWFLLMGIIDHIATPSVTIKANLQGPNVREMYIRIYPETTIKDIEGIWWMVKFHSQYLLGGDIKRLKQHPQLERDARIVELAGENITHDQIAQKIREEFNCNITYKEVGNILHRLRTESS